MSESKSAKPRYKTTNWAAYNAALKARGALTIWLDKDMQWYAPASGKRGRQHVFSDAAIQFCLSIKCLFGLALRQSLGLVQSLLHLAGLDWFCELEELAHAVLFLAHPMSGFITGEVLDLNGGLQFD